MWSNPGVIAAHEERGRTQLPGVRRKRRSRRHEAMAQFSHELRNCLGTARNALRLLELGNLPDADRRKTRRLVGRQLEQMSRLVDDLQDAALVRDGRLQLERARIDLRAVLAQAVEAVAFRFQERRHRLLVSTPEGPAWIFGDSARLEQVFVNLLVNAAKYTEVGGNIELSLHALDDAALVRVRDDGIGISAELLPRVFEPYVQARRSSRRAGLGLGLPLVRSLVQCHGGRVAAASAGAGRGSEFSVWLPAVSGHPPTAAGGEC
ncbi:MAG TPA: HAMP domain-containing sensor histidine kinase [Steroidobacteraceae bacterium]|jgi:signal transduction histidine kinase|nr:HAMP domain-containing sensor histidine kinase [Steroidobacteraceae bacterium]